MVLAGREYRYWSTAWGSVLRYVLASSTACSMHAITELLLYYTTHMKQERLDSKELSQSGAGVV